LIVRRPRNDFSRPLRLAIRADVAGRYVPVLRRGLRAAHAALRSPIVELSLAIVSGRQMATLHRRFLNRGGATDVLSFELDRDRRGRVIAGEIVICHSIARQRARRMGHPVSHELLLYGLHGLLHLSGFDDRTGSAFAAMHAREDQILAGLGFGPVFSRRSR
jgi:probable rRNA maturation factor